MPYKNAMVQEHDFHVNHPAIKDDYELSGSISHSTHHPRPVQYHIAMIKAASVFHRFKSALKSGRWTSATIVDLVTKTDESLAQIVTELPIYLQNDASTLVNSRYSESEFPWMSWQRTKISMLLHTLRINVNQILQNIWSDQGVVFQRVRSICIASSTAIISLALDSGVSREKLNAWFGRFPPSLAGFNANTCSGLSWPIYSRPRSPLRSRRNSKVARSTTVPPTR